MITKSKKPRSRSISGKKKVKKRNSYSVKRAGEKKKDKKQHSFLIEILN